MSAHFKCKNKFERLLCEFVNSELVCIRDVPGHAVKLLSLFALTLTICGIVNGQIASVADLAEQKNWQGLIELANSRSVDVDQSQADGTTALHWSSFYGEEQATAALLEQGADPNSLNDYDVSPLSLACENGNAEVVALLIAAQANTEAKRLGGERPLMLASRNGDPQTVELLISAGAKLDARETKGQTALMWAAAAGNVDVVKLLINAGADTNYVVWSGFSPLMFAARNGREDVVRFLIQNGFDINTVIEPKQTGGRHPRKGMSPLLFALESGHLELALKMIEWGADPNDQRSGFAPLHAITWVRRTKRGDDPDGDPAPRISGKVNSLEFVRRLVGVGADVNLKLKNGKPGGLAKLNPRGATPFFLASAGADLQLMELLIELGADPKLNNADDCSSMMAAAGVGVVAVDEYPGNEDEVCQAIRRLHELGVDVNHVDKNFETAIHGAAYRNFPAAVSSLAEIGADPKVWNQKNRHGWTPFDIASGKRPGSVKPSPATYSALEQAASNHPAK